MSVTGSSLSEARQAYQYALSTNELLDEIERKTRTAKLSYADLYNVLQDVMILLRRLGLSEDMQTNIAVIYRIIAAMNALRVAMYALLMAQGPVGWLQAGIGLASTVATTGAMIGSYG